MYVKSLQNRKPVRICRSVYSREELREIESHAERGGARIIKTILTCNGARTSVLMELNISKRQF